jgi:hypothetical protein
MAMLEQLIEEIKELKNEVNHRSALKIFSILDNNKKLFIEKMDPDYFAAILKNFEDISYSSPKEYGTENYKREYQKYFESLSFHLNRIF